MASAVCVLEHEDVARRVGGVSVPYKPVDGRKVANRVNNDTRNHHRVMYT